METRVRVCGPLEVSLDGERVDGELRGLQGRVLFAFLVLHRDRAVTRDMLTDALWPGALPADPAAALRTQLSRVRKAIGAERLGRGSELGLALPDDTEVDLERAREATLAAEAALGAEEWQTARAEGEAAIEIAERGFLAGFQAPWVEEIRHELEELGFRAHECIATASIELGGPTELAAAERSAKRMTERAPNREAGHMLLLRALIARGRRAEALGAYGRFAQRLRSLLGIEPSPELKALHAELLRDSGGERRWTTADAAATELPAASPGPEPRASARSPLPDWLTSDELGSYVGRGPELRQLREQWIRVRSGDRRLTLIEGEPGIGKTRLAVEFALAAQRGEARILYGRCDEDAVVSYQPFVESIRHYLRSRPAERLPGRLAEQAAALVHLIPEFEDRLGRRPAPRRDWGGNDRYRLFEAFDAMLDAASERTPTLLVVDDLHWADRDTLLLLRHLIRSPRRSPLMIIGLYRAGEARQELREVLAELRKDRLFDRIMLGGFDTHETASMVSLLVGREVPEDFAESLVTEMSGNPFAIHAVVRQLAESGRLGAEDEAWPAPHSLFDAGLPEDLQGLVDSRLARLDERMRRVLAAASVIGFEFDAALLQSLPELGGLDVVAAIEESELSGLVSAVPTHPGRYRFSHGLNHRALYSGLSAGLRARLHHSVAEELSRAEGEEADRLAAEIARHHLAAGGEQDKRQGVAYSIRAAEAANEVHAYTGAAEHYRRALETLDELEGESPAEGVPRPDLLLRLANTQRRAGEVKRARASFLRLARAARGAGELELFAESALGFSGPAAASWGQRDYSAIELLLEALQREPDDLVLGSRLRARLAQEMLVTDEPRAEAERDEAEELSSDAIDLARRSGSPRALAGALSARIYVAFSPERLDERIALLDEMDEAVREGGEELLGQRLSWRIGALLEQGLIEEVDAEIERAGAIARTTQSPAAAIYHRIFQISRAHLAGRFDEADELIEEAQGFGERAQYPDVVQLLGSQRLYAQMMRGEASASEPLLEQLTERFPRTASWRSGLLSIYCQQGRLEKAREQLDALLVDGFPPKDSVDSWLPAAASICVASERLDDPGTAALAYEGLVPYAERIVTSGLFAVGWSPGHYYLGLASKTVGELDRAADHLQAAVAIGERIRAPHWVAEARLELASALRLRDGDGDRQTADRLEELGLAGAQELGLGGIAKRAEVLQGTPA